MIRGALILAVGFSLGYTKAMRDSDEISELLRGLIEELKHFPTENTASKDSNPEEEVVDVEPEEATEVPEEDEVPEQGETA